MRKRIEHRLTETGEELKRCSQCHEWLPLGQYSKHTRAWDGLQPRCRKCGAQYKAAHIEEARRQQKEYRTAHAEERRRRNKEYRATHPEKQRDKQLKYRFGISQADYGALLASQGGVCAICGKPPNGKALAVDHDHETGV